MRPRPRRLNRPRITSSSSPPPSASADALSSLPTMAAVDKTVAAFVHTRSCHWYWPALSYRGYYKCLICIACTCHLLLTICSVSGGSWTTYALILFVFSSSAEVVIEKKIRKVTNKESRSSKVVSACRERGLILTDTSQMEFASFLLPWQLVIVVHEVSQR